MTTSIYIYENTNYGIVIGESVHDASGVNCYQIVNKRHGVVEAETTVYPAAVKHAEEFNAGVEAMSIIDTSPFLLEDEVH